MIRKAPRVDILKVLYARSGNECAFPGCDHPIFNDQGLYIAQLCHIEAVSKGGPRYNESQSDEEGNSINNLLFMCHRHHKETDNVEQYSVERLKKIKGEHEKKFTERGKEASKEMIRQILFEINYFWDRQKSKKFELEDLKIDREFDLTINELFNELEEHIKTIQNYCDMSAESDSTEILMNDLKKLFEKLNLDFGKLDKILYYENPFINRNSEMHNIGRPNFFSHLSLCINQLKVKVYEELQKCFPNNIELKKQLQKSRTIFEKYFDSSYYVD